MRSQEYGIYPLRVNQFIYPLNVQPVNMRVDNVKRGRGRPKLTWDELVKRDLKDWNISKEIALDRSAWRLVINVLNLELISFGFHL